MNPKPRILFEDNHLLIVDKPAGWLVQEDKTGDLTLSDWATAYIRKKYNKPGNIFCHPAHRIDRPVGGIVVFVRTSKAAERLTKLFHDDDVEKTYLAEVQGVPEFAENTLVHWLIKDSEKNKVKAFDEPKGDAKRASLQYRLIATIDGHSLMEIKPKTGRPHQIRVQMTKIGCPIRGDLKYGYPTTNADKNISLHAFKMTFMHPVKKEPVSVTSIPPWGTFKSFIHELG